MHNRFLIAVVLVMTQAGCTNLWREHYTVTSASGAGVPLEGIRLADVIGVTPGDSPPPALREQLQERPLDSTVDVLGVSEIVVPSRRPPSTAQLKAFARGIGADLIVMTTTYAGQSIEVVGFPRSDTTPGAEGAVAGPARARVFSIDPEVVLEDRYIHRAVFLRWSSPGNAVHNAPRDE